MIQSRGRVAFTTTLLLSLASITAAPLGWSAEIAVYFPPESGPLRFAAQEIASAAREHGDTTILRDAKSLQIDAAGNHIVLGRAGDADLRALLQKAGGKPPNDLNEEGFTLQSTEREDCRVHWIFGGAVGGAMYGGLELAEQIRIDGLDKIQPMQRNPHFEMRGTKFNIPLDVRTPSYSDMSDAAQANISDMWDFGFWQRYLDALARHRYNYVSLWNLHPFPSLVKVPEYPQVALSDVKRSTIRFAEDYPTIATELVTAEMLEHTETLRRMTIEDKIDFWRRVMQYGRDRNIDFYIITWNIYTYGVGGKYGITDAIDNRTTVDYFRKSVRELLRTYPLLRGIGLTTGENMGEAEFQAKEDWAFATYGQGVLDVAREQPQRRIRFIHRQHQTRAQDIARTFAPLIEQPNVEFVFSFKYAQAHALSSTTQTFHRDFVPSLGDHKTLWTLRNDDALMFRWGAPDFVRKFVENIPYEPSQGYYFGSDMWVWGRDFLSGARDEERELEIEIEKHWYHWLLWGRLGYDPTLSNDRLRALLAERFPGVPAGLLFNAWQHASMVYPLTTGFHWADFDFQWYIEGSRSRPGPAQTASGFHDVNRFITLGTHPGTDNIPILKYVEAVLAGKEPAGTTPLQVAERIDAHSEAALAALSELERAAPRIRPTVLHRELMATLGDIRSMALLGRYYAAKIRGATHLALFRAGGQAQQKTQAIDELELAADAWRRYTASAASRYRNPLWTNRVGHVDWTELTKEVDRDIEVARHSVPGE